MPSTLTLFVLACLFGLAGGYAVGAMLAMLVKHDDPQTAFLWGLAAVPAIAVAAWCFLGGRKTASG